MRCKNKVTQYVAAGFHVKPVKSRCISTGVNGQMLLCEKCEAEALEAYPQGWSEVPGDICKHGNFIGDAYGPDYMCHLCEIGE